jgi:hypothetical protein
MYGQVLFILSQPARPHIWRTLARFSSAWVSNVRVNKDYAKLDIFVFYLIFSYVYPALAREVYLTKWEIEVIEWKKNTTLNQYEHALSCSEFDWIKF